MAKKQSTIGKAASAVKGAATSVGKAVGIIGDKRSTRKKSTTKTASAKKSTAKKPAAKRSAKKK